MKNIYRGAALGLAALSLAGVTPSWAWEATPLYKFDYNWSKGNGAVSSLIADSNGALYGTTHKGGSEGYGTIFKLTPPVSNGAPWTHSVLYSFCLRGDCLDGSYPTGGLIFDAEGALYGTTQYGGLPCGESGCGTVFKLSPPKNGNTGWTHAVIYYFKPFPSGCCQIVDGTNPTAGLIADQAGVLYGTTSGGGICGYVNGSGTVFKLVPNTGQGWEETVIYDFCGSGIGDGADPTGGLIFDPAGADQQAALYGTTYEGGANGYGTVFKLTPPASDGASWPETVLYSFAGGDDGAYPKAGLVADADGRLYGTTTYGGANCDIGYSCGTVFQLVPPPLDHETVWQLHTIHSFLLGEVIVGAGKDGQDPVGGVIFGEDGSLYGTTEYGGAMVNPRGTGPCGFFYSCGTVFRLTFNSNSSDWVETALYKFCSPGFQGCPAGANPTAGLLAYHGMLYGTASSIGVALACDCGAIFSLDYPAEDVDDRRGKHHSRD
jgi:uncharacterized repeat protein (TIGR03803 family)